MSAHFCRWIRRSAHDDPRNHLSVPSLSEREEMADLYSSSIVCRSMCEPYGGMRELRPVSGGGGGLRIASMGFPNVEKGERRVQRLKGCTRDRA